MFEAYEKERLPGSTVEEYYDVLCGIMKRIFGIDEWETIFDGKR